MGACTRSAAPVAFLTPSPSWGGWKGHQGGLCQTGVQAEPGAGRAGWHGQGAELCAHVPAWHAAGNGERFGAWGASCEGKPHPRPALFLGQDAASGPGGLSLQPLRCSAGVAALFHIAPAAEPCQSSFPEKRLPMGLSLKCI